MDTGDEEGQRHIFRALAQMASQKQFSLIEVGGQYLLFLPAEVVQGGALVSAREEMIMEQTVAQSVITAI